MKHLLIAGMAGTAACCAAATLELRPMADTTLFQAAPGNNMGAHTHVAIGTTAQGQAARGLFRFDFSTLPTNAAVRSVSLTFNLPALGRLDPNGSEYSLHRVMADWGEGTKTGNQGFPATAAEASWLHSDFPTLWQTAGGDFSPEPSATQVLGPAPGVYTVDSTTNLIADVKGWIRNPETNFGWLMKALNEAPTLTARRFSSRETAAPPLLRLEYDLPVTEMRFTSVERAGTNLVIRWTGGQGEVVVEGTSELPGNWQEAGTSGTGEFQESVRENFRFYRLRN